MWQVTPVTVCLVAQPAVTAPKTWKKPKDPSQGTEEVEAEAEVEAEVRGTEGPPPARGTSLVRGVPELPPPRSLPPDVDIC